MAKYQKYAEYIDSGVEWLGEIPSHWDCFSGKRIFASVRKAAYETDQQLAASQKYGVIPQKLMMELNDSKVMLALKGTDSFRHVDENNFVISLRSFEGGIEYSEYTGCVSPAYTVLQNKKTISYAYFKYLFKSAPYIAALQSTTDSLRDGKSISYEQFGAIPLPFCHVDEQQGIATFLDHETAKIDTLIAKQEKLIELLKEKRQAVISHAVTKGLNPNVPMKDSGVEWLGEVPEHWKVSKLKYESEVVDCRNKTPEYFDDGDYFVVRTTNVKNQQLNFNGALYTDKKNFDIWTQRGIPPVGSILFTREAPTGEVCLVPEDLTFCMGQRMMNFIAHEKKYSDYLFDYLISDCLERYINSVSHGSTVTHLRVEQVENIPVLVPPQTEIKEIHLHILNIKNQFNKLEDKATQTIDLLKERRTALISAAVTGKIDVHNWQHPNQNNNNNTELSA
ncbi:restriction endonuclease subunit S [Acinetobacter junii]|uniref:restriction endonuclease subunit S n=1 Tax=Acinetobacter junii TaxID=40215 RepID=UPI003A8757FF